jgi:hypothetical protein
MPTTPRRARLWLKQKHARVVRREPFTIQLRFLTTTYTQAATVGVDTGSKVVAIAATTNGEVVFQAEVHLRNDIRQKMRQRRQFRRTRRSRKTRYRPKRFANRRRPTGWLAPSLRSKAEATVKAVHLVASLVPARQVNVAIGSFDTQKLQNPAITGVLYQHGEWDVSKSHTNDAVARVARPTQGWMIIRQPVPSEIRKEGGASSPR